MDARHLDQLRIDLIRQRTNGQITKSEYDEMLAELARLERSLVPAPVPAPASSYVPDVAAREDATVAAIPIPLALQVGELLDKYELKSSQRGAMGEVWKAWDLKAQRWAAVKLLPRELRGNEVEIARLRRQFGLVEKLDHPGICRLYDLNEHPVWGWYEVMRWIDGKTLAELREESGGRLSLERTMELLRPVAEAIDFAHAQKVLHRDVKPQNIMVDEAGKVIVIDFGLAAEVRGSLSRVSRRIDSLSGTPHYLAPELWNEAPESAKSDQYALAVTAYELLAGRKPFEADNLAILMARVQSAEVPTIAGVSDEVMTVLRRALAKAPGERYATCGEFVCVLASCLRPGALPVATEVASAPPPFWRKLTGWITARSAEKDPSASASLNKPVSPGSAPAPLVSPFSKEAAAVAQRAWAKHLGREVFEKNFLGMEMALIPPGEFWMGSDETKEQLSRESFLVTMDVGNESPRHRVRITTAFWLGRTAVTVGQFRKFVEATGYRSSDTAGGWGYDSAKNARLQDRSFDWRNVGWTQSEDHPVVNVTFSDAKRFLLWLSEVAGVTCRLPTEAEWEYACRAGSQTRFWTGDKMASVQGAANVRNPRMSLWSEKSPLVDGNRMIRQHFPFDDEELFSSRVGKYRPNGFGLFDMLGNTWDWCEDLYDRDAYKGRRGVTADPRVISGGSLRVIRGGGWRNDPVYCRSACRGRYAVGDRSDGLGFRVVVVPPS